MSNSIEQINIKENPKDKIENKNPAHQLIENLKIAKSSGNKIEIEKAQRLLDEHYAIHNHKHSFVTNSADFIPVIGSGKMIIESMRGRQFGTGKRYNPLQRIIHGVAGAGFLAADMTGIGSIASLAGKGAMKIGLRTGERVIEKGITEAGEKVIEKNNIYKAEHKRMAKNMSGDYSE